MTKLRARAVPFYVREPGGIYSACHSSNLNGRYLNGNHSSYANGVNWYPWKGYHYSAERAEMKIKPVEA